MSLRFTILSATLVLATACSPSADSADKTAASQAPGVSPNSTSAAPSASAPQNPAAPIVLAQANTAAAPAAAPAGGALYTVVDKNKVDANTLVGWKTWRAQACERCHGAAQEGMVGPSLINSMKTLSKDEFMTVMKNGRIEKGMPNFGGIPAVADNLNNLYAYLKGRSDGAIAAGRLEAIAK